MFKNLSFLTVAAAFGLALTTTACVVSIGDGDSGDDVNDDADTTDGGTDAGTDGTSTDGTSTDDDVGTDTTDGGTTDATTGTANMCGWGEVAGVGEVYACGFEGTDPSGTNSIDCPDGLVEGDPCDVAGLSGFGCCDANGDNWYCGLNDANEEVVVFESCAG